jgi:hypothetical protein
MQKLPTNEFKIDGKNEREIRHNEKKMKNDTVSLLKVVSLMKKNDNSICENAL